MVNIISQFEDAFRFLRSGKHTGKAVIDWQQEDTIHVSNRIRFAVCLSQIR